MATDESTTQHPFLPHTFNPTLQERAMPDLISMDFNGDEVTYVLDDTGEPLWPIQAPCKILGYADIPQVLDRLDDDEKRRYPIPITSKSTMRVWCVNEAGMYRLIFRSEKPEAEQFRRWLFHEVLPAIRKHGRYSITNRDLIAGFLSPAFLPWERRFELSFFQEVCRVYGQPIPTTTKHSPMVGWFIAKYVYDVLPPAVRAEMDIINPIVDKKDGSRKLKLHQLLQEERIKDFLEKRLEQLMTIMRLCKGQNAKDKFHEQIALHDATIGLEVKLSETNRVILSLVLPQQLSLNLLEPPEG
jgi:prophage antirepressor-like protein